MKSLIITMALLCSNVTLAVVDRDNDGLIEIGNLSDFNELRNNSTGQIFRGSREGCPASGCYGFELSADIDFASTNGNWLPIDLGSNRFYLQGNSHTLSNFATTTPFVTSGQNPVFSYGLFKAVEKVTVNNLRITKPMVIIDGNSIPANASIEAGIIGGNINILSMKNVSIENALISFSRSSTMQVLENVGQVGGVVAGMNGGILENVHFNGSIDVAGALLDVGGIAGSIKTALVMENSASGRLQATGIVGGLVAHLDDTNIYRSYSTADVITTGNNVTGGIAAVIKNSNHNITVIEDVYSTGNIVNGGGLVGIYKSSDSYLEFKSSYSKSIVNVEGQSYAQLMAQMPDEIVNYDSYQIIDPAGVALPAQVNSYTKSTTLAELTCASNPVANCPNPELVSSWRRQYWNFGSPSELPVLIHQSNYPWVSTDRPNSSGDHETIGRVKRHAPEYACDTPIDFQVKEKKSGYVFSAKTPQVFDFFNAKQGLQCTNSKQAEGACNDYEVSYLCGDSLVAPQWTAFFNNDSPSDDVDDESMPSASVCASGSPIGIRTRIKNSGVYYYGAPQIPYNFTLKKGFTCRNTDNGGSARNNTCKDYEVRMVCEDYSLTAAP